MSTARAPRPRQARSVETEAALKAAARRVLARKGYFNTKIADITTEAGRSLGSFHYYFASKEELLAALARDFLADLEARQQAVVDPPDRLTYDHVRAHIGQYWHTYREHRPEMVAVFQASMADPAFFERWRTLRNVEFDELRELTALVGEAQATRPEITASAALSMLELFCYVWQSAGGDPPGTAIADDEAIDTLTSLLLYGIAGQPRPSS